MFIQAKISRIAKLTKVKQLVQQPQNGSISSRKNSKSKVWFSNSQYSYYCCRGLEISLSGKVTAAEGAVSRLWVSNHLAKLCWGLWVKQSKTSQCYSLAKHATGDSIQLGIRDRQLGFLQRLLQPIKII